MTEYKTFDDYVKNTFSIEPTELTHISPEEQKKKTVAITADELINIWNELTELKLKAGRPKWHKIADGDLPKENKLYLVAIKDNGLAIAYFNGRHWETKFNLGDFGHLVETVIAWCEIPTFTDKE